MVQSTLSKKIGLIGGLAPRAGIFYYEQLLLRFEAQQQPLDLVLQHADVGRVLAAIAANDRAGLGRYLGTLANALFDAGAEVVAITAVAPHLAFTEVAQTARGPMVNVLDAITRGVHSARVQRVAVFGNRAVMESHIFGAVAEDLAVTLEPSLIDEIHALYSEIALRGKRGTPAEAERLSRIARTLIETHGAQAIVLAGTDLASFYADQKPDYPCIDVAQLHLDQLVEQS